MNIRPHHPAKKHVKSLGTGVGRNISNVLANMLFVRNRQEPFAKELQRTEYRTGRSIAFAKDFFKADLIQINIY